MVNPKLQINLDYGAKGAGKSMSQARTALMLFDEYAASEKKYPLLPKRIYFGNQKFSKAIEEKELGIHLFYWSNFQEMRYCPRPNCWKTNPKHPVHDTDIGHDEIGKDFPAGSFSDTPKWTKQVFSHLRKRGNRYFANTQVFEDIDIAFRRQIDCAYEIQKVFGSPDITATRPAPKMVWGVIQRREFDPKLLEWERDPAKRELKKDSVLGEIFFIRKRYVEAYDTTAELPPYKADTLSHVELWCEDENCPKHGKNSPTSKPVYEHHKI